MREEVIIMAIEKREHPSHPVMGDLARLMDELETWPRRIGPLRGFELPVKRLFEREVVFPILDMMDKGDKVIVKAEVPGIDKKDIEVSVTDDLLTIKGESKKEIEVKEENYFRSERSFGSFSRVIRLPAAVKADQVKANLKDGVLEIELPKVEPKKVEGVKIDIK